MTKTVLMRFWKTPGVNDPDFIIDGCVIPEVTHTKFSGVHMDNQLNWDYHKGQIYSRVKANQYLLSMTKNLLSISNLKKLHYAHIYSHIQYGISIWGAMASKIMAQKVCLKQRFKKPKTYGTDKLFKELELLKVKDIAKLEQCKLGFELENKQLPNPTLKIADSKGRKKMHRYHTRNKNLSNIQRHSTTNFNNSYLCRSMVSYTEIPVKI